jgi:hypothetical protein
LIITEYKYFTIRIKNQLNNVDLENNSDRFKTYKLIYQICQYEKLKNQDKKHVKKLRKSGIKIITKKRIINNKTFLEYFKEYAIVNKNFKYRKNLVNIILNKEIYKKESKINMIYEIYTDNSGKTKKTETFHLNKINNNEDFLLYQNTKNIDKTTKDELMDEYIIILDTISSYLMCDNKLANCININHSKEINFKNPIIKSIQRNRKKSYSPTPKQRKEEFEKWKNKNKRQVKRWHKSKTYKINNLYSYTYGKTEKVWDWLKQDWVEYKPTFNLNIKRLIDPSKPYVAKWCLVDIDNNFKFNDKNFIISNDLIVYKVKNKSVYINNELNNFTNEAEMEQILCFYIPYKDKYYFFDENIDKISNKYITQTK